MSRFLAIDQSLTSTGWALWEPEQDLPCSGSWKLCEGVKSRALGFAELRGHLLALHRATPISSITFEQPVLAPKDKMEKLIGLYGLAATVECFAQPRQIDCQFVNVKTWRKTFLGPGYKDLRPDEAKAAAMKMARFYGQRVSNHDEAEAFGILDHALLKARVKIPWREAQPLAPTV